ncbi:hypothetical protein BGZ99_009675 [Dissophora globulifera]|uniref:Uncharacterized protein n=1 Tax=Dissophora globulifera TaxID=979702 RepID=A0A9P6UN40_9FUNG|nr:hypothetical protein BGZ99_009675 [Dissophora globulifera]
MKELMEADSESTQDIKPECIANLLSVPVAFEGRFKSFPKCDLIKVALVVVEYMILQSVDVLRHITLFADRTHRLLLPYALELGCKTVADRLKYVFITVFNQVLLT